MSKTSVLLHRAVFTMLLLLLGSFLQHVWAQTPPPQLTLTTEQQTYQLGESIVLTMGLTNVADEPQQYGPVRVLGSRLQLRILNAGTQEVPVFSYWGDDIGAPWIENDFTVTLPGETEQGSLIITHFYDLTQAGTYTLEVSYEQTEFSSIGKRNIFREETTGVVTVTTSITIEEPASGPEQQAALLFTPAMRELMGGNVADSVAQALDQVIQDYSGTYLAEPASFYRAFFNERVSDGSTEANLQTRQSYQTFLQLYPTSRFIEFAVQGLNHARFRLDPPLPGQINFLNIFLDPQCGDNLFRIANFNEQAVPVRYEVDGTSEAANLVLPANTDTLFRTQNEGGLVRLFLDGELIQARFADPSSCGLLGQPILPDLPGALTLASDDVSASFSGNAFAINGNDHTLSGQPNPSGDDAHGIFTTTAVSQQSLLDALGNNQRDNITGSGPDPDIAQDALAFDPAALVNALLALVTETLTTSPGGTLGSPEAPVVAYAPDGLTLTGNLDGTGVLLVDGPYLQRGSVQWTGLVVVRADEEVPPSFEMRGNVGVTGGVLILNETNQAASLEVTGSAEVRYSREVFEMLRAALFPNP